MSRKTPKHNTPKVKLDAVREVLENNRKVIDVANEFDIHRDTLYRWIERFKQEGKRGLDPLPDNSKASRLEDQKRIRELEKKLREKEVENEILKKFQAFLKENE